MSDRPPPPRPPRRPRYRGTHPRRFDERYKELDPQHHPDIHAHIRAQGRTPAGTHIPVLMDEVLAALRPAAGETAADCTLGYGGHALELLRRLLPGGRLIGFDVDAAQLDRTRARLDAALQSHPGWTPGALVTRRGSFSGIGTALQDLHLDGYDLILADLGVSSMQIDDPARGFSYKHDGPLDMRMDDRLRRTAADLLAAADESEIAAALRDFADEPDHERIARAIVQHRRSAPLRTTRELVDVILQDVGGGPRPRAGAAHELHPAALTFQALRMWVNDEPAHLRQLLRMAPYSLRPGGRIAIISFHSGEDRLVKHAFRDGHRAGDYSEMSPEVVRPGPAERRANPRSASARLRWAVRV